MKEEKPPEGRDACGDPTMMAKGITGLAKVLFGDGDSSTTNNAEKVISFRKNVISFVFSGIALGIWLAGKPDIGKMIQLFKKCPILTVCYGVLYLVDGLVLVSNFAIDQDKVIQQADGLMT